MNDQKGKMTFMQLESKYQATSPLEIELGQAALAHPSI